MLFNSIFDCAEFSNHFSTPFCQNQDSIKMKEKMLKNNFKTSSHFGLEISPNTNYDIIKSSFPTFLEFILRIIQK